jgi:hypothetical protein
MGNENELWYVIGIVGFIIWGIAINMGVDDADEKLEIKKDNIQDKDIDDGSE